MSWKKSTHQNVCIPVGRPCIGKVVDLKPVSILVAGWYRESDIGNESASTNSGVNHRCFNNTCTGNE